MKSRIDSKKALTHERILSTAARAIRGQGFHGVGIAEVMKKAGMTHGGFYSHFESKDQLLAHALQLASHEITQVLKSHASRLRVMGQSPFAAFVEAYLSQAHVDSVEDGCPIAALCGEFPNQSPDVVDASRVAIGNLVELVEDAMGVGANYSDIWAVSGALIGAMQLARALGDNASGRAVLSSTRRSLLSKYASLST